MRALKKLISVFQALLRRIRIESTNALQKLWYISIPSPLNNTFEFVNSPKSGYLLRDGLNRNPFWDLRKQF